MKTRYLLLVLSTLLLVLGSALAYNRPAVHRDGNSVPIIVTPNPSEISAGGSSTVTVYMNQHVTSNTVVTLSTNDSLLSIPSTVTVLTGDDSAQFTAQSSSSDNDSAAQITASCNGYEASGDLDIVGRLR